jgi:hypothetical protein
LSEVRGGSVKGWKKSFEYLLSHSSFGGDSSCAATAAEAALLPPEPTPDAPLGLLIKIGFIMESTRPLQQSGWGLRRDGVKFVSEVLIMFASK